MAIMKVLCLIFTVLMRACVTETTVVFSCDFGRGEIAGLRGGLHECGITSRDWDIFNERQGWERYRLNKSLDELDGYYILQRMNDMGRFTLPSLETKASEVHLSFIYQFIEPRKCGFEVIAGGKVIYLIVNATDSEAGWKKAQGISLPCGSNSDNTCPTIVFKGICGRGTGVVAVDDILVEAFDDGPTTLDTFNALTTVFETLAFFETTNSQRTRTVRPKITTSAPSRPSTTVMTTGQHPNILYPSIIALVLIMLIVGVGLLSIVAMQKWRAMSGAIVVGSRAIVVGSRDRLEADNDNEYINFNQLIQRIARSQQETEDPYIPMMPTGQGERRDSLKEENAVNDRKVDDISDDDEIYVAPDHDLYVNGYWFQSEIR